MNCHRAGGDQGEVRAIFTPKSPPLILLTARSQYGHSISLRPCLERLVAALSMGLEVPDESQERWGSDPHRHHHPHPGVAEDPPGFLHSCRPLPSSELTHLQELPDLKTAANVVTVSSKQTQ